MFTLTQETISPKGLRQTLLPIWEPTARLPGVGSCSVALGIILGICSFLVLILASLIQGMGMEKKGDWRATFILFPKMICLLFLHVVPLCFHLRSSFTNKNQVLQGLLSWACSVAWEMYWIKQRSSEFQVWCFHFKSSTCC